MSRPSSDSILNTLKGRIWLAVSALAILNCFLGFVSYLIVSYLSAEPFFTVFITFFVLAFVTMIFGWWLSNEVTRPIDNVTLLAKSLERSATATLPRTTGSVETDELLNSLHRNFRQIQNVAAAMDQLASGRTDLSNFTFENGDKLTLSFQKLIAKVTDSISAKHQLEMLGNAIRKLENDLARLRSGDLNSGLRSEHPDIKGLADGISSIAFRLSSLADRLQSTSIVAERTSLDSKSGLHSALVIQEENTSKLRSSISRFAEAFTKRVDPLAELDRILERNGSKLSSENAERSAKVAMDQVEHLRSLISETSRKVQKLRSRTAAFPRLARGAQEISRRANLISINANLRNGTSGSAAGNTNKEIEAVSKKSEAFHKEVNTLEASLASEIAEIETLFSAIGNLMPAVLTAVSDHGDVTAEYESRFAQLMAVRTKLQAFSGQNADETKALLESLDLHGPNPQVLDVMRNCEQVFGDFASLQADLRESVSDIRVQRWGSAAAQQQMSTVQAAAPAAEADALSAGGDN